MHAPSSDRDPLRILFLTPTHWSAGNGGAELQIKSLVERLVGRDHLDLHFAARSVGAGPAPHGYTLHTLRARRALAGTYLLELPGLMTLLRQVAPDVIYQRVGCAYTGAAAWYARRHRCRMVWHVSSDRDLTALPWSFSPRSPIEQLNRRLIDYGARYATSIIVQSTSQQRLAAQRFGRRDAIRIPNFHRGPSSALSKPASPVTVCWIGNVKEIKRPEVFLRLARAFAATDNVDFVMVGARQMRERDWARFVAEVREVANLRYLGAQTPASVDELLARAHILVNTSPVEGFPNTFVEAWLRDVSVVSLVVNPDGVFDGERAGICASGSFDKLVISVRRLVEAPELRDAINLRAKELAGADYSERNIDRLIAVLEGSL